MCSFVGWFPEPGRDAMGQEYVVYRKCKQPRCEASYTATPEDRHFGLYRCNWHLQYVVNEDPNSPHTRRVRPDKS